MDNRCNVCSKEWQERYNIIIAACCVFATHNFINQFEYVEETIVTQDGEGVNIAVVEQSTVNVKE